MVVTEAFAASANVCHGLNSRSKVMDLSDKVRVDRPLVSDIPGLCEDAASVKGNSPMCQAVGF